MDAEHAAHEELRPKGRPLAAPRDRAGQDEARQHEEKLHGALPVQQHRQGTLRDRHPQVGRHHLRVEDVPEDDDQRCEPTQSVERGLVGGTLRHGGRVWHRAALRPCAHAAAFGIGRSPRSAGPAEKAGVMSAPNLLSVIVPAYDEAARIPATLRAISDHFANAPHPVELIVVDDGSRDDTAAVVRETAAQLALPLRLLCYAPNRGKGFALKVGFAASRGDRMLFSDADLSTPIEEADRFLAELDRGADVAIGSRKSARAQIAPKATGSPPASAPRRRRSPHCCRRRPPPAARPATRARRRSRAPPPSAAAPHRPRRCRRPPACRSRASRCARRGAAPPRRARCRTPHRR